ncbi:hypothetical protein D3C84_231200 [compost metagenome]
MQHISAITFSISWIKMSFYENPVNTNSNSGFGNSFDHIRSSTGYTSCLVRLLQRVCHIQHSCGILLHSWNSSVINNHVLVSKHGSAVCNHHILIVTIQYFLYSMLHTFRTHELSFFQVHYFSGIGSSHH